MQDFIRVVIPFEVYETSLRRSKFFFQDLVPIEKGGKFGYGEITPLKV